MKTRALLEHFGSLRVALAAMALLAAAVLLRPGGAFAAPVIALLALNLVAALVSNPLLRRRLPLLVAHLAALALVVLVAVGRLAALDGHFELTQGLPFDGQLLGAEAGPLHVPGLQRLNFVHQGFEIDYAAGRQRGPTRNSVAWIDGEGQARHAVIGDHRPLVLDGYRIYTSPNKGFAPVLRWQPDSGPEQHGALHLPSFPMHELKQSNSWQLPDGRSLWVQLQIDEALIDPAGPARFRMPDQHRLVLRLDGARVELEPGAAAALPGGRIVYEGLRTWMGYRIAYDPMLPWLLAASLLAALSMALHYALKFMPARAATLPVRSLADG